MNTIGNLNIRVLKSDSGLQHRRTVVQHPERF